MEWIFYYLMLAIVLIVFIFVIADLIDNDKNNYLN